MKTIISMCNSSAGDLVPTGQAKGKFCPIGDQVNKNKLNMSLNNYVYVWLHPQ